MSFQFPISRCVDGDPLFQQIENHLADGVDLISVGVIATSVDVYFDWLLSGRSSRNDVVVATASSFTSNVRVGTPFIRSFIHNIVLENNPNTVLATVPDNFTKTLSPLDPPSS